MATKVPNRSPFRDVIDDLATALSGATYINFLDAFTTREIVGTAWINMTYLIETGSHACKEWQRNDNIRLICLTNSRSEIFWSVVKEEIKLRDTFVAPANSVLELSDHSLQRGSDTHEVIREIGRLCRKPEIQCKFYIHYCTMPPNFVVDEMPSATGDGHLEVVREMQSLGSIVAQWPLMKNGEGFFQSLPLSLAQAYRMVRLWARANGILGPDLGYFDSMTLLWVAFSAYGDLLEAGNGEENDSSAVQQLMSSMLKQAFRESAGSTNGGAQKPNIQASTGRCLTNHMSSEGIVQIDYVLHDAEPCRSIMHYQDDSEDDISKYLNEGWNNFVRENGAYILVQRRTWGQTPGSLDLYRSRARQVALAIAAELTSRRRLPETNPRQFTHRPRIWPELLLEKDGSRDVETYAIGLGQAIAAQSQLKVVNNVIIDAERGALQNCPKADGTESAANILAEFDWRLDSFLPESTVKQTADTSDVAGGPQTLGAVLGPSSRFRTASQAISRLRHDPAHYGIEYDLAYEDRFAGLVWMPLEEWGGKATEEEDFIPEHRVRLMKRRSDGHVVWDRAGRFDRTGG